MTRVRCASCHRVEQWEGDAVKVVSAGGLRRPEVHADLASFRTIMLARKRQAGAIVGWCDGCAQPLVLETGDAPPVETFVFETPAGQLTISQGIDGPSGAMSDRDAEAFMEETLRTRMVIRPFLFLFQGSVLTMMVVPFLLWTTTVTILAFFFWSGFGAL